MAGSGVAGFVAQLVSPAGAAGQRSLAIVPHDFCILLDLGGGREIVYFVRSERPREPWKPSEKLGAFWGTKQIVQKTAPATKPEPPKTTKIAYENLGLKN